MDKDEHVDISDSISATDVDKDEVVGERFSNAAAVEIGENAKK